jgi:predicted XRE-type DNA-binding protein
VFEDLGLSDAAALLAKSELVSRISDIIAKRGLTQAQAAKVLGVSQPKVSALLRGNLDGFSSDRLFRFLNALGSDIEIAVKPRPRSSKRPAIRVIKERLAG